MLKGRLSNRSTHILQNDFRLIFGVAGLTSFLICSAAQVWCSMTHPLSIQRRSMSSRRFGRSITTSVRRNSLLPQIIPPRRCPPRKIWSHGRLMELLPRQRPMITLSWRPSRLRVISIVWKWLWMWCVALVIGELIVPTVTSLASIWTPMVFESTGAVKSAVWVWWGNASPSSISTLATPM